MALSAAYEAIRWCTATRADRSPCDAWATWDSTDQVCNVHGDRHHRGARPNRLVTLERLLASGGMRPRARCPLCRCGAYERPHRPAGGRCAWPNVASSGSEVLDAAGDTTEELLLPCSIQLPRRDTAAAQAEQLVLGLIALVPTESNSCNSAFSNFLPPDLQVLSVTLEERLLVLDLDNVAAVGSAAQRRYVAQIVFTVTGLPGIDAVRFKENGEDVGVAISGGTAEAGQSVTRSDFPEFRDADRFATALLIHRRRPRRRRLRPSQPPKGIRLGREGPCGDLAGRCGIRDRTAALVASASVSDGHEADERTMRTVEVSRCRACGGEGETIHQKLRDRVFGAPGTWAMRQCRTCASLWLDPRPHPDDLSAAYRTYYTHAEKGQGPLAGRSKAIKRLVPGHRAAAAGDLAYLGDQPPGAVLDVGCGKGRTLTALSDLGWRARGVDMDPAGVETALAAGCDVSVGTIDDAVTEPGGYDAVVAVHVIEHVEEPAAMVDSALSLLRPGGLIVVVTPNADSWLAHRYGRRWRGLEPPRHLQIFTPRALRSLLVDAGYQTVSTSTTVRGANAMARAERQLRRQDGQTNTVSRKLLDAAAGEAVQTAAWLRWRRHPDGGEELVAIGRRPEDPAG